MITNKCGEENIITSFQSLRYVSYDFVNSWVTSVDISARI